MAKVDFLRVESDAEVENIDIKDGQLIYSKSGKTFMDYDDERIPTGAGEVDTEMSDTSENAVQNKVIKEYVDGKVVNTSGTETDKAYSQSFINDLNTCSETEHIVGTWYDGTPLYSRWFRYRIPYDTTTQSFIVATIPKKTDNMVIQLPFVNQFVYSEYRNSPSSPDNSDTIISQCTNNNSNYNLSFYIQNPLYSSGNITVSCYKTRGQNYGGWVYFELRYSKYQSS